MIRNTFFSSEQFKHKLDVVSIENALIDLLVRANDSDLKNFGMTKGIMQLVDEETQKKYCKIWEMCVLKLSLEVVHLML